MKKHSLRTISTKKLLKLLQTHEFPVGIVRKITVKQLLKRWDEIMDTNDLVCLDTSMLPKPEDCRRPIPQKVKSRRIKCSNSHHIMNLYQAQFEKAKGTRWYWYPGDRVQNEMGTSIEDFLGMTPAQRKNQNGPLDYRQRFSKHNKDET